MSYTPVTVEQFRGLRLLPEQGEAPGAVSMLNADLSRDFTQVGSRGGLARLGTGTASYHRIGHTDTDILVLRNTGSGILLQPVPVSTGTFGATYPNAGAYGTAASVVTSVVHYAGGDALVATRTGASNEETRQYFDNTGMSAQPALWGSPRYFAVTPYDDRLVMGHFTSATGPPSGANGSVSTVFFSNPAGVYGVTGADDWVALDVNDGDPITGMVAWRELFFVIKRSKLYVFYSTSTDSTGGAVFNYRTIDLPTRARATTNGGGENMVAGADGVYLLLSDGIYRTTGDTPQLMSRDISPLFDGTGDSASLFPSTGDWTIGYATNRVYLSYAVGSTYRTLVFDCILREWLLWDISVGASAVPTNVMEWVDSSGLPTAYVVSGAKLFSFTKTATSDDGTAIASSYQSGFESLGSSGQQKRIPQVWIEGTGTPTFSVFTDYGSSDSTAAAVTLGTSPATAESLHRKAHRGRLFSFKFSATSGRWSVARLTWDVAELRAAGMRG